MFKPIRVMATLVYLLSMFLTLFCAFKVGTQRDGSARALLRRCIKQDAPMLGDCTVANSLADRPACALPVVCVLISS